MYQALKWLKNKQYIFWSVVVLSYAYYVNMAPVFLPFSMSSLFGLGVWQNFLFLFSRNFSVLLVLFALFSMQRTDLRYYGLSIALLFLVAAQAMCVYSDLPAVAVLVRVLMSAGLAFAMCSVADSVSLLSDTPYAALVWLGFSLGLMHFLTDGLCYSLSEAVKALGWLTALRASVLLGCLIFMIHFFLGPRTASIETSVFQSNEVPKPMLPWAVLWRDRTARATIFVVVFLLVPVLYLSGEMGLYALYHLQKKPIHSILITKLFFSFGWLLGLALWVSVKLPRRFLPYCITICSGLMVVTAIISIFLQPLTLEISVFVMFFIGLAYSGALLAFQILRERFHFYDGYRSILCVFISLGLSGLVVSLIVLFLVIFQAWFGGGLHQVNLDKVFHGLMLLAPITSLLAFLGSFYLSPVRPLKNRVGGSIDD